MYKGISGLALALALALAGGGYYFFVKSNSAALATYTGKQIGMGAVAEVGSGVCPGDADYKRLVCLAGELKKTATPELLGRLQRGYSAIDTRKWSNFPPAGYKDRVGPTLGEFTAGQLVLVKAILKQASGIAANEGYDEMEQTLNADEFLSAAVPTDGAGFASGNFHIAFIGEPSAAGTWQLYFGGHHMAFANTYTDGKLVGATPSFRGVEPFTPFQQNGRDNAPMAQEQAAFAGMLASLSPEEQAKAKLAQTFTNIIVGPQQDDAFPSVRDGLKVGGLDAGKQALVLAAIATYVTDIDPASADAVMAKYRTELAETFVAFSGTTAMNAENDYVRIDGPSLWIEYSMQPGRSIPGVHPHSIWRDRATDYGGNK